MIEAHGLSFSYPGGRKILSNLDFHIGKGESVAILGANGSGKSTLLKLISTLLPATQGTLVIAGINADSEKKAREIRRRVAYVFQNPDACFVSDTVIEDAEFTPLCYGFTKEEAEEMALSSLEHYGILDKKDRLISTLSGGEKERAILSSVSSMDKDIYIFDEVLTFLDEKARKLMLSLISKLKTEGKTILFVTQNSDEALEFEKTMVIADGEIKAFGNTREILKNVDMLKKSGIRVTKAARLALKLEERGMKLPELPLEKEELCSLLRM